MTKLKLVTVVGTRPELIRLSRIIPKLDEYFDHILVHTGQNYDPELSTIFFSDLNIRKPNYSLNAVGKTSAETIGKIIIAIDEVLAIEKPDAFLVLGDTNSAMSAISAKRRKIPIFHMEAGNRCFDMRVPEEINRKIVDHTADINLPYSDIARQYLLAEGLPADQIIKTGSPLFEVLNYNLGSINQSKILDQLKITSDHFFLVSAHREENIDSEINFNKLIFLLNTLAENHKLPIIVSTHPRMQKKINEMNTSFNPLIQLLKPLGFFDYNKLQICAKAVLSDSGSISEESSILNFPALNIREAHERPEAMEEASVMMVGLDSQRILQALEILKHQSRAEDRGLQLVSDYCAPNVSEKIVRIIQSYTDYVNRVVWKKY